jgi:hypothetical protein
MVTTMEMKMKARKVVQGKNTMQISLPMVWVKSFNVEKGDSLSCKVDKDGRLIVWKEGVSEDVEGRE